MKASDIAVIGAVVIGGYLVIQYFGGKSLSQAASSLGSTVGTTAASIGTGIGSGIFKNVINPTSPIAMQQNNDIRSAFNLPPDTLTTQYYPFTPIPLDPTQQNNDIRSLFGLLPENNNVQYYPFTNIPIGRTA